MPKRLVERTDWTGRRYWEEDSNLLEDMWEIAVEPFMGLLGPFFAVVLGLYGLVAFCAPNSSQGEGYSMEGLRQNIGRIACDAITGLPIGRIVGVTTFTLGGVTDFYYQTDPRAVLGDRPVFSVMLCNLPKRQAPKLR